MLKGYTTPRTPRGISWTGEAELHLFDHPYLEVSDLAPSEVGAGFRFSFAFTVDDVVLLEDLRGRP